MVIARIGFHEPNWDRPIDLQALVRAVPEGYTSKGMISDGVVKLLKNRGLVLPESELYAGKYLAFKDYPLADFMHLATAAAKMAFPHRPPRRGIYELGRVAYNSFSSSLIGGIIFSLVNRDIVRVLKATNGAYNRALNHGQVKLLEVDKDAALLQFKDIYNFVDSYHVGVCKGALEATTQSNGSVKIRKVTQTEVLVLFEW